MNRQAIKQKVTDLVCEKLSVTPDRVEQAQSFEELGADSLDMVEIVMEVESAFEIMIDDQKAEKLIGIDQVVDYIVEAKKEQ